MSKTPKTFLALAAALLVNTSYLGAATILVDGTDSSRFSYGGEDSIVNGIPVNNANNGRYQAGVSSHNGGTVIITATGDGSFSSSSLQVSQIPVIEEGGIQYFAFVLDAQEPGGSKQLDITEISLCVSDSSSMINPYYEWSSTDTLTLNGAGQNPTNSPSGDGNDLLVLIPVASLTSEGEFDIMDYIDFKVTHSNSGGGSEEWTVYGGSDASPLIPEPSSSALMLMAGGLMLARRRR